MNNEDRGALFSRERKSEKSPAMGGDVVLSRATIKYLMECAQSGKEPKIELAAWRQTSKKGDTYLSLKATIPYEDRQFTNAARRRDASRTPSKQPYRDTTENHGHRLPPDDDIPPWE